MYELSIFRLTFEVDPRAERVKVLIASILWNAVTSLGENKVNIRTLPHTSLY